MNFREAMDRLESAGYHYYGRLMISGCDLDTPTGERVLLTEPEIIKLAESL